MRPETAAALYDMSQAADRIVEATEGKAFDDYQDDWYFQSAVEPVADGPAPVADETKV